MAALAPIDGGLSSRTTRYAFLFAWATAFVGTWIGGGLRADDPVGILASLVVLAGVILVTSPRPGPLRPLRAALVIATSLGACALILLTSTGARENWFLSEAVFLSALLLPRGNTRSGLAAVLALAGSLTAWGLLGGFPAGDVIDMLGRPLSAAIACGAWRLVIVAILRRRTRAAGLRDAASAEADAAQEAECSRRKGIEEITHRALPLLSRLVAGEPIDASLRASLLLAEADIRDLIRYLGTDLHPVLESASAARARGVAVKLLGEQSEALSPALQQRLAELLDTADEGSLVVRFAPRPTTAVVTVLIDAHGAVERLDLARDGRILRRA